MVCWKEYKDYISCVRRAGRFAGPPWQSPSDTILATAGGFLDDLKDAWGYGGKSNDRLMEIVGKGLHRNGLSVYSPLHLTPFGIE